MTVPQPLGPPLAEQARRGFVGRHDELALLESLAGPDGEARVVHLHGDPGIGKSALLRAFLARLRDAGVTTVALDCRATEPTERGLLDALARATGSAEPDGATVAARLGELDGPVLLALDHYEVFPLMDTWLRQVLVPALEGEERILLAGREPPVAAWFGAGWDDVFRDVALGPLDEREAQQLLGRRGHEPDEATRLNRIARGHPLALTLASAAAHERPDLMLEDAATTRVVTELTRMYLDDAPDPLTRQALEAAAVVRRVTRSLLGAMVPEAAAPEVFDRLLDMPFADCGSDGVFLHDAVRESIASFLRATDPSRHRDYRRAAWRRLRTEVREAGAAELWRYTADMLFLIDNPVVREAFFPSGGQPLAVEPARAEDEAAIFAIAARHDGPDAVAQLAGWWLDVPSTFSVVRERDGAVRAFFVLLDSATILPLARDGDPVVAGWRRHLRDHPLATRAARARPAPLARRRGRRGSLPGPGRVLARHQAHIHGDAAGAAADVRHGARHRDVPAGGRAARLPAAALAARPGRARGPGLRRARRPRRRRLRDRRPRLRARLGRRLARAAGGRRARPSRRSAARPGRRAR